MPAAGFENDPLALVDLGGDRVLAPGADEVAGGVEALDPVVGFIGDVGVTRVGGASAGFVDGDVAWVVEFTAEAARFRRAAEVLITCLEAKAEEAKRASARSAAARENVTRRPRRAGALLPSASLE